MAVQFKNITKLVVILLVPFRLFVPYTEKIVICSNQETIRNCYR